MWLAAAALGVYESSGAASLSDTETQVNPAIPEVWPQDPPDEPVTLFVLFFYSWA